MKKIARTFKRILSSQNYYVPKGTAEKSLNMGASFPLFSAYLMKRGFHHWQGKEIGRIATSSLGAERYRSSRPVPCRLSRTQFYVIHKACNQKIMVIILNIPH